MKYSICTNLFLYNIEILVLYILKILQIIINSLTKKFEKKREYDTWNYRNVFIDLDWFKFLKGLWLVYVKIW